MCCTSCASVCPSSFHRVGRSGFGTQPRMKNERSFLLIPSHSNPSTRCTSPICKSSIACAVALLEGTRRRLETLDSNGFASVLRTNFLHSALRRWCIQPRMLQRVQTVQTTPTRIQTPSWRRCSMSCFDYGTAGAQRMRQVAMPPNIAFGFLLRCPFRRGSQFCLWSRRTCGGSEAERILRASPPLGRAMAVAARSAAADRSGRGGGPQLVFGTSS